MQTYDWYKNTYLETHLKLVEQSIQLAQSEFQTRVQMLQFYEKQLDNLRQGKTASGTGASREAVGKFNADAIRKRDEKLAKQASLVGYDFNGLIGPMADQVSARVDQGDALIKIAQEQGFDKRGETQLERVRLAQELRNAGAKAARKGGETPDMRKLSAAAATIARADETLMNKTEAELIELQKDITKPSFATGSVTRRGSAGRSTGTVDLGFNINDVQTGPDGKTLGIYYTVNNKTVFEPLTIEQERIYNLENRVNRLRSQIDETYGQDIDIEKIIERGRDIYSRQYAPQNRKQEEEQSRIALMSEIKMMDEQKGTNLTGVYSAYSAVKPNDRRIDQVRRGALEGDEDSVARVAQTIYQMKKNKQEGLANDVALKLLGGDQAKANEAVGIAVRALIADSSGQDIPDEPFTEKLEDTIKSFANRMGTKKEKEEQPQTLDITPKKPEPAGPFEPFEDFLALKTPRQAAALRQHADLVGGPREFMRKYEEAKVDANLRVNAPTEDIIAAIPIPPQPEPSAPLPTFKEGASLEDMVQQITGVDPRSGIQAASTFEDPATVKQGPEFGIPYYQFDDNKGHAYLFNEDGTVTYITSKGKKLSTKFGSETDQFKQAMEYFERTSGK